MALFTRNGRNGNIVNVTATNDKFHCALLTLVLMSPGIEQLCEVVQKVNKSHSLNTFHRISYQLPLSIVCKGRTCLEMFLGCDCNALGARPISWETSKDLEESTQVGYGTTTNPSPNAIPLSGSDIDVPLVQFIQLTPRKTARTESKDDDAKAVKHEGEMEQRNTKTYNRDLMLHMCAAANFVRVNIVGAYQGRNMARKREKSTKKVIYSLLPCTLHFAESILRHGICRSIKTGFN